MNVDPRCKSFRRREGKRPLILGHRGARRDAPENTISAFELAMAQGADGVELDVRMSQDGELFVHHDDHVRTASGRHVLLSRLSGAQVRALSTHSGHPLPSLHEVLLFAARTGALLNVELKGDGPAPLYMAREAARQIRIFGGTGILLSSFSVAQVFALARLLPELPVALLMHKKQRLVPWTLPLRSLGAVGAHPEVSMVTPRLLHRVREQSCLVNVWTVNDPEQARELCLAGVDALITDVPGVILKSLCA